MRDEVRKLMEGFLQYPAWGCAQVNSSCDFPFCDQMREMALLMNDTIKENLWNGEQKPA